MKHKASTSLEDSQAVATIVKQRDIDRYWSVLFSPAPKRSALMALYAFDTELARIPHIVSEPMVGQIRLQWWRDAIDLAARRTKTGNPIADALSEAIYKHRLSKNELTLLVDAKTPELHGEVPKTMHALDVHLEQTAGLIFKQAAAIFDARDQAVSQASLFAGVAYGLTRILQTLPQQIQQKRLLIPEAVLQARRVDVAATLKGQTTSAFKRVFADLRDHAGAALDNFKTTGVDLSHPAFPAFLPLAITQRALDKLTKVGFDPLLDILSINPVTRFRSLWRYARCGII